MNYTVKTSGSTIYCGDQLEIAAETSQLRRDVLTPRSRTTFTHLGNLIRDARNANYKDWVPTATLIKGVEHDSAKDLRILVVGAKRAVEYYATMILGQNEFEHTGSTIAARNNVDIIVSDHPLAMPALRQRPCFRSRPWIRQCLRLGSDWDETLARLSPKLRSEVRRILRRYKFSINMSKGSATISDYYRTLHAPYVSKRFGRSAILGPEAAFVGQFDHLTRIDLLYKHRVVAASLVELQGAQLAIRSCSMDCSMDEISGRADALDYFCLLVAHLRGCTTLDFGISRPHLENGHLNYKAKWGAVFVPLDGFKADVCMTPVRRNEATLSFLRRNYFVQQDNRGHFVRVYFDAASCVEELAGLALKYHSAGLDRIELAADPHFYTPALKLENKHLVVSPIALSGDPLSLIRTSL